MASKVVQFWHCMTEETVSDLSSRYHTEIHRNLPQDLVLITSRRELSEYRGMLEPSAARPEDVDEFLAFLVRTSKDGDDLFIEEAWGVDREVPFPDSKCFKLL